MQTHRPTFDEFLALSRHGNVVPVYRTLIGDTLYLPADESYVQAALGTKSQLYKQIKGLEFTRQRKDS